MRDERFGAAITRRRFLGVLSAGTVSVALACPLGCGQSAQTKAAAAPRAAAMTFRSRPDLRPPAVEVNVSSPEKAAGYIFVSPKKGPGERAATQDGPLIVDDTGEPVWFHPLDEAKADAFDLKVQTYRGEPVLTWWVGRHTGYGQGEYVIADGTYREVGRLRAGNGMQGDHHEFMITPEDTALITIYNSVPWDLSPVGGPVEGMVLEGVVQELDIETGEVIFEWHSLDHVGLDESFYEPSPELESPFDYFHINSVDPHPDGFLIVSARRTSAVYKIDRRTGEVVWRLGGKKSDFDMGPGTVVDWQHDARHHPDGTVTVFDNGGLIEDVQSRAVVIEVDDDAMSAILVGEFTRPDETLAATQGSMQLLPNGNVFVGWGSEPFFSEFGPDGKLLFDASFPHEVESYRAFRFPWRGQPQSGPAVVVESGRGDEVTLYASWNGSTEVATWQVLAGGGPGELKPVGIAPREGFETAVTLDADEKYFVVRARDASGRVLATTKAVEPADRVASASTSQRT